jgi:hypothetical protein
MAASRRVNFFSSEAALSQPRKRGCRKFASVSIIFCIFIARLAENPPVGRVGMKLQTPGFFVSVLVCLIVDQAHCGSLRSTLQTLLFNYYKLLPHPSFFLFIYLFVNNPG